MKAVRSRAVSGMYHGTLSSDVLLGGLGGSVLILALSPPAPALYFIGIAVIVIAVTVYLGIRCYRIRVEFDTPIEQVVVRNVWHQRAIALNDVVAIGTALVGPTLGPLGPRVRVINFRLRTEAGGGSVDLLGTYSKGRPVPFFRLLASEAQRRGIPCDLRGMVFDRRGRIDDDRIDDA